ncbi:HTH-type transcriptional repressor of NAD biosynthesis genes [Rhodococcus sp. LBL1]|nr:HTH-type transcriptional repressor of NAD biosynthesis genes [Rhodococcus sp. LBL1]MDH6686081.1 HTH-type transcriptional repressor of NAD biosynthesis genes [Rhodococcus sp. LBL2]
MTAMYRHALVIGKFYPPHFGHHHLVRSAAWIADRVTVVVMASAAESIPLAARVSWMRQTHAGEETVLVTGIVCDAPMDLESTTVWAAQVACMRAAVRRVDATPIDAVVSSEKYGDELARWFGATHVCVDPDRVAHPVSGTGCRADLAGHWDLLDEPARAGLTTRIVVLGAESTGTTTVSRALAQHYRDRGGVWARTGWVPEYGRQATHDKLARLRATRPDAAVEEVTWTGDDFADIAAEQTRIEEGAARTGSPVLVCDTDAFATTVWERRYLGTGSARAWEGVADRRALYLLTDHTCVPFVQDGIRDGEHIRAEMTRWFEDALTATGRSWVLLTGPLRERVDLAVRVVDLALAQRSSFGAPL